eukprot:m.455948 g.455948  ORF g.455948 m.455948 type:complete len:2853 (-) comp20968_c0_seq1:249-8807(-)
MLSQRGVDDTGPRSPEPNQTDVATPSSERRKTWVKPNEPMVPICLRDPDAESLAGDLASGWSPQCDTPESLDGVPVRTFHADQTGSDRAESPGLRREWQRRAAGSVEPPLIPRVSPDDWLSQSDGAVSAGARLQRVQRSIQVTEREEAQLARLPEFERKRLQAEIRRAQVERDAERQIADVRDELEIRRELQDKLSEEDEIRRAEANALRRMELEARFGAQEAKRQLEHEEKVMLLRLKQEEAEEARLRAELDKQVKAAEFATYRANAKAKREAITDKKRAEVEAKIAEAKAAHAAAKERARITRELEAQMRQDRNALEAERRRAAEIRLEQEAAQRRDSMAAELTRAQQEAEERLRDIAEKKAEEEALAQLTRDTRKNAAAKKRMANDALRKATLAAKREDLLESERRAEEELLRKIDEAAALRAEKQKAAEIRREAEREARRVAAEAQEAKLKAIQEKAKVDAEKLILETQIKVEKESKHKVQLAEAIAQQEAELLALKVETVAEKDRDLKTRTATRKIELEASRTKEDIRRRNEVEAKKAVDEVRRKAENDAKLRVEQAQRKAEAAAKAKIEAAERDAQRVARDTTERTKHLADAARKKADEAKRQAREDVRQASLEATRAAEAEKAKTIEAATKKFEREAAVKTESAVAAIVAEQSRQKISAAKVATKSATTKVGQVQSKSDVNAKKKAEEARIKAELEAKRKKDAARRAADFTLGTRRSMSELERARTTPVSPSRQRQQASSPGKSPARMATRDPVASSPAKASSLAAPATESGSTSPAKSPATSRAVSVKSSPAVSSSKTTSTTKTPTSTRSTQKKNPAQTSTTPKKTAARSVIKSLFKSPAKSSAPPAEKPSAASNDRVVIKSGRSSAKNVPDTSIPAPANVASEQLKDQTSSDVTEQPEATASNASSTEEIPSEGSSVGASAVPSTLDSTDTVDLPTSVAAATNGVTTSQPMKESVDAENAGVAVGDSTVPAIASEEDSAIVVELSAAPVRTTETDDTTQAPQSLAPQPTSSVESESVASSAESNHEADMSVQSSAPTSVGSLVQDLLAVGGSPKAPPANNSTLTAKSKEPASPSDKAVANEKVGAVPAANTRNTAPTRKTTGKGSPATSANNAAKAKTSAESRTTDSKTKTLGVKPVSRKSSEKVVSKPVPWNSSSPAKPLNRTGSTKQDPVRTQSKATKSRTLPVKPPSSTKSRTATSTSRSTTSDAAGKSTPAQKTLASGEKRYMMETGSTSRKKKEKAPEPKVTPAKPRFRVAAPVKTVAEPVNIIGVDYALAHQKERKTLTEDQMRARREKLAQRFSKKIDPAALHAFADQKAQDTVVIVGSPKRPSPPPAAPTEEEKESTPTVEEVAAVKAVSAVEDPVAQVPAVEADSSSVAEPSSVGVVTPVEESNDSNELVENGTTERSAGETEEDAELDLPEDGSEAGSVPWVDPVDITTDEEDIDDPDRPSITLHWVQDEVAQEEITDETIVAVFASLGQPKGADAPSQTEKAKRTTSRSSVEHESSEEPSATEALAPSTKVKTDDAVIERTTPMPKDDEADRDEKTPESTVEDMKSAQPSADEANMATPTRPVDTPSDRTASPTTSKKSTQSVDTSACEHVQENPSDTRAPEEAVDTPVEDALTPVAHNVKTPQSECSGSALGEPHAAESTNTATISPELVSGGLDTEVVDRKPDDTEVNEVLSVAEFTETADQPMADKNEGVTAPEPVIQQTSRSEAEQKAKESVQRTANEAAEREAAAVQRAAEEAARLLKEEEARKLIAAAEQKAKDEAERMAKEDAERQAKVEAERKANEEAAERRAKKEAERLAELEAAEQKAKEEAAKLKAQLEAAERKAEEEAERLKQEAADRQAAEDSQRKEKEEALRIARAAAEQEAQEEADRLAKLQEQRRATDEKRQQTADKARADTAKRVQVREEKKRAEIARKCAEVETKSKKRIAEQAEEIRAEQVKHTKVVDDGEAVIRKHVEEAEARRVASARKIEELQELVAVQEKNRAEGNSDVVEAEGLRASQEVRAKLKSERAKMEKENQRPLDSASEKKYEQCENHLAEAVGKKAQAEVRAALAKDNEVAAAAALAEMQSMIVSMKQVHEDATRCLEEDVEERARVEAQLRSDLGRENSVREDAILEHRNAVAAVAEQLEKAVEAKKAAIQACETKDTFSAELEMARCEAELAVDAAQKELEVVERAAEEAEAVMSEAESEAHVLLQKCEAETQAAIALAEAERHRLQDIQQDTEIKVLQMEKELEVARLAAQEGTARLREEESALQAAQVAALNLQQEVADEFSSAEPFFYEGTDPAIMCLGCPMRYVVIEKSVEGKVGLQVTFDDSLFPNGSIVNRVTGPAAECGTLLIGDTILEINGESMMDKQFTDLTGAIASARDVVVMLVANAQIVSDIFSAYIGADVDAEDGAAAGPATIEPAAAIDATAPEEPIAPAQAEDTTDEPVSWAKGAGTSLNAPRFQAVCRVRTPVSAAEEIVSDELFRIDSEGIVHAFSSATELRHQFPMTAVLGRSATQADVYQVVETAISATTHHPGGNVSIVLHGPNSAGKHHTAIGDSEDDPGILLRAFNALKDLPETHLTFSILEVDGDSVRDLLGTKGGSRRVDLHHDAAAGFTKARGAAEPKILNHGTMRAMLESAKRIRRAKTAEDQLRLERSHVVYRLFIKTANSVKVLQLVVLAAPRLHIDEDLDAVKHADRARRQQEQAAQNAEASRTNKCLTQLATVLQAVQSKTTHVPYRSTKLTYALQGTLGGANKCIVISHVNPDRESMPENIVTLKFAATVHANKSIRKTSTSDGGRPRAMSFDTSSIRRSTDEAATPATAAPIRKKRADSFHARTGGRK